MMKRAIALGMAAAVRLRLGCTEARSENGGPTVDRNYQVGEFDRIELAGPYDVTVRTGSAISVHARGNQKAIDNLEVVVEDGVLVIRPKKKNDFAGASSGKVALTVTVPTLRGAAIAGSGDIRIDRVGGRQLQGRDRRLGQPRRRQRRGGPAQAVDRRVGQCASGGGRAKTVEYSIAGSGDIDAKGVAAETASVSIAGSGNVDANATEHGRRSTSWDRAMSR